MASTAGDTHAVPLRDHAGKIMALLGLTRDITRQKQLEYELRENEQKLSNILNNLNAMFILKTHKDAICMPTACFANYGQNPRDSRQRG